jgi:tryptophan synthase alpha chain
MNRIDIKFLNLHNEGVNALAVFVTAGFPHVHSTPTIVRALEEGGADIIELGMPFSDPLADGPVIQQSSAVALANGVTLESILDDVRTIRSSSNVPVVLMGYLNPILSFGEERFFREAAAAGVDGVILPEVPLEEFGRFSDRLKTNALSGILMVTPMSGGERIRLLDEQSSGFLYCVSTTGVTGMGGGNVADDYLKRIRAHTQKNPLMVGFGIATPDDATRFGRSVDGVIVGSAFISFLGTLPSSRDIGAWVREFKGALQLTR